VAQLNADIIATTAFGILNRRGVAGFTMRAVAKALRVTPMALYNHVADKAGLAALVVNAAIKQRPLPPPGGVWREDLWKIAAWARESKIAYPALAELQRTYRIWTPAMLHHAERWMGVWQHSGLDLKRAVVAASTSAMAIDGLADVESIYREWVPPDHRALQLMPNARLLLTADYKPAKTFELGVRAIIEGLHAQLSREQKASTRARRAKRNNRRSR
jgi:AcrR family transcriptional regulator